jgi:aspartate/methionine/tyrosine aminotransferase
MTSLRFAGRAGWDLAPNDLTARIEERRATGLPVIDLTESNPTRCALPAAGLALRAALAELAQDPRSLRYEPDPRGDADARATISAYHTAKGTPLAPECVVLTSGTSEGYAHLFRLLADPGERVLVPSPSYPLFGFLADLESVEVAPYPLRWRAGGWRIDFDTLAAAAGPRTRAVLVVHPNNPTGSLASAEEAAALRRFCRERGLALVADEVFADYRSATAPAPSPRTLLPRVTEAEDGPLTFVLSGASKVLALPQLKLAWVAVSGPRVLRTEALARLEVIADTYLSVSTLSQLVLPRVFAARAEIAAEITARVAENRLLLAAHIAPLEGVELLAADGGWAAILRVRGERRQNAPDEDSLVTQLVQDHGVIVQPGWFFDLDPEDDAGRPAAHLVLSLLPEPQRLEQGLAHVVEAIDGASR